MAGEVREKVEIVRKEAGEIEEVYKYLMMNSIEDQGGIERKEVDRML